MDDARVWSFERDLWIGDAALYEKAIDKECLMVVPAPPFVLIGQQAIEAVKATPRWSEVELTDGRIARPEEGLIVVAYRSRAAKEGGSASRPTAPRHTGASAMNTGSSCSTSKRRPRCRRTANSTGGFATDSFPQRKSLNGQRR